MDASVEEQYLAESLPQSRLKGSIRLHRSSVVATSSNGLQPSSDGLQPTSDGHHSCFMAFQTSERRIDISDDGLCW